MTSKDDAYNRPAKVVTKRNKGGRPTSYTEDMPERLLSHFRVDIGEIIKHNFTTAGKSNSRINAAALPSMTKFCEEVGVTNTTLHEWRRVHPEFSLAYTHARAMYEELLVTLGLSMNNTFTVFMLKANFGWRDNVDVTVNSSSEKPVRLKIVTDADMPPDTRTEEEKSSAVDWGDD